MTKSIYYFLYNKKETIKVLYFFFFICFYFFQSNAIGQSIFDNPITGTNPNTSNPYIIGQTIDPNITVSGIGRGSGITGTNANNRYNANAWSTGGIDLNDYFEFTLTPNVGYKIDFASFVYTSQVSSGAPSHAFRSSVDSYATNIGTATTTGTTLSLSGASYQGITSAVTFRFYTFNIAAAGTTFSINDFTFNGTVSPTSTGTSDIIATIGFTFSTNINYISFQGNPLTTANSVEVGQFTIRDGGASAPDADATATTLTTLGMSLSNSANIRKVAIFDGITNVAEVTGSGTLSFTGLSLVANDNNTKIFSIRVSFNTAVTDNQQFQLIITSATATGSGFATGNAGGASTSIASDNNRIEVTADRLAFNVQPTSTALSLNMSPSVVIQARDINGNLDLDYTGSISITSTGTMDATPKTATAVASVASFANILHTFTGTGLTLTASASGLTSAVSGLFDINTFTVLQPGDLIFVAYDNKIASGADDKYSIMNLVDLNPGTKFWISNATYELNTPANVRTKRWYSCDSNADENITAQEFTYNGPTILPKGSIICVQVGTTFVNGSAFDVFPSSGSGTYAFSTGVTLDPANPNINISTSAPDAIFLMQGTWSGNLGGYRNFTGRVLGGIQDGGTWYNVTTATTGLSGNAARRSRRPPEIECFAIQGSTTIDEHYAYYTGIRTGTQPVLLSNIVNFVANWNDGTGTTNTDQISANTCLSSYTFNISGIGTSGQWNGGATTGGATNWFNCRNWDNLAVPTETTNVTIKSTATDNPTIDITASFSDDYGDIAECNNINVSRTSLTLVANPLNKLNVYGNLTLSGTGILNTNDGNNVTTDGEVLIKGNFINSTASASNLQAGNGKITFNGTSEQTILGLGGESFYNVTVNNPTRLKLLSNINVNNLLTLSLGKLDLNAKNIEMGDTGALSENIASDYVVYDATATNDSNKGGYMRITNRTVTASFTNLQGIGLFLGRTAGSNFDVQVLRRHYAGKGGIAIKRIYDVTVTSGTATGTNTQLQINYADSELNGNSKTQLKMYRFETVGGWSNYTTGFVNTPASNIGSVTTVNGFSAWTLLQDNIVLPNQILVCNAILEKENQSLITWTRNQNAQSFTIQKSYNGVDFFTIGQVEGNKFVYNDILTQNQAYYRVLQNDFLGQILESNIAQVQKTNEWIIYPNPSAENIYLKGFENNQNIKITAFDAQGKTLFSENDTFESAQKSLQNNFQLWAKGIYLLKIQSNNTFKTFKVVKQ